MLFPANTFAVNRNPKIPRTLAGQLQKETKRERNKDIFWREIWKIKENFRVLSAMLAAKDQVQVSEVGFQLYVL